jgi:hypothetical protein
MWYFRSKALAEKVKQVIAEEKIEMAYGYHLRSGQFLADLDSIPRVIAIQPAQVLHFGRRYKLTRNPVLRAIYGMEYRRLHGYEVNLAEKFNSCLLISEKDRDAIDPEHRLRNVFYNPTAPMCIRLPLQPMWSGKRTALYSVAQCIWIRISMRCCISAVISCRKFGRNARRLDSRLLARDHHSRF